MTKEKKPNQIAKKETYLPSTPNEFLKIYSLTNIREKLRGVTTVSKALDANTPSIGVIIRKYGIKKIEAYIKIWLINLNEVINLKRPLKEHQIDECAYLIVDGFKNITIADINIIFKKAKTGEYGELYETLSVDKILRWFNEYFNERCNVAGDMSRRKHENAKYKEEKDRGYRTATRGEEGYRKIKAEEVLNSLKKKENQ